MKVSSNSLPKIRLDANGGKCPVSSMYIVSNGSTKIPSATRAGYTFLGWYTDRTGAGKLTHLPILSETGRRFMHAGGQISTQFLSRQMVVQSLLQRKRWPMDPLVEPCRRRHGQKASFWDGTRPKQEVQSILRPQNILLPEIKRCMRTGKWRNIQWNSMETVEKHRFHPGQLTMAVKSDRFRQPQEATITSLAGIQRRTAVQK